MSRPRGALLAAAVLVITVSALAVSAVGPAPVAAAAPGPVTRCALDDPRLDETSGLAVTPAGPAVVDDSGNATVVYTLAPDCSVASSRAVGVSGRDVEDLARSADGTLWLADIGDNDHVRTSIALIRLPVRGPAEVRRLVYPDGPHDAETLLLPADGRPVIVTKDLGGRSGIYTTTAPPPAGSSPTPLRHVGEFLVPLSSTEGGPIGPFGRGLVTGGALSADGRVAAVRTYTDAWLYRVGGGTADDVVAALRGTPVDVPLPGEPQGEAVAFTADGTLLSAGEAGTSPSRREGDGVAARGPGRDGARRRPAAAGGVVGNRRVAAGRHVGSGRVRSPDGWWAGGRAAPGRGGPRRRAGRRAAVGGPGADARRTPATGPGTPLSPRGVRATSRVRACAAPPRRGRARSPRRRGWARRPRSRGAARRGRPCACRS